MGAELLIMFVLIVWLWRINGGGQSHNWVPVYISKSVRSL